MAEARADGAEVSSKRWDHWARLAGVGAEVKLAGFWRGWRMDGETPSGRNGRRMCVWRRVGALADEKWDGGRDWIKPGSEWWGGDGGGEGCEEGGGGGWLGMGGMGGFSRIKGVGRRMRSCLGRVNAPEVGEVLLHLG